MRPHSTATFLPEQPNTNIIWLSQPGPGGGGGGGGNKMKEPPRQAELPGKDKITVPVEKAADARAAEAGQGRAESGRAAEHSREDARGGAGFAAGRDRSAARTADVVAGIGQRRRRRAREPAPASARARDRASGPASGGGTGGGVYRPGNGVTLPRVLREVRPQYTSDAMRAKVQGTVLLECVVQDGRASATCRWFARSTRRSASIRKPSRPRSSGASRPARASASRCPC